MLYVWVAFECNRLGRVWTNLELSLYNFWNQTKEEFKWKFLHNPDSVSAWPSRFGKQMFNYFCLSSTYCQVPETNWTDWRFYAKQHIKGMISCFQVGSLTCCLYFYRKPTRIHSFACTPEIAVLFEVNYLFASLGNCNAIIRSIHAYTNHTTVDWTFLMRSLFCVYFAWPQYPCCFSMHR